MWKPLLNPFTEVRNPGSLIRQISHSVAFRLLLLVSSPKRISEKLCALSLKYIFEVTLCPLLGERKPDTLPEQCITRSKMESGWGPCRSSGTGQKDGCEGNWEARRLLRTLHQSFSNRMVSELPYLTPSHALLPFVVLSAGGCFKQKGKLMAIEKERLFWWRYLLDITWWYHQDPFSFHFSLWLPPFCLPSWSATWLQLSEPHPFTALCLFSVRVLLTEPICIACLLWTFVLWENIMHLLTFDWVIGCFPGPLFTFYSCGLAFFHFPSATEPLHVLFILGKANLPPWPEDARPLL